MAGILFAKIRSFIRNPWTFLLFTAMSIGFAILIGSSGNFNTIQVPVTGSEAVQESPIGDALKENKVYNFVWKSEEDMLEQVETGKAEAGVMVQEEDYQVVIGVDSANSQLVEQTIKEIYMDVLQQEKLYAAMKATTATEKQAIQDKLDTAKENPVFSIQQASFRSDDAFIYDTASHSLFGFTLFFVIYTIAYTVLPILLEKKEGIWDRMILSPLKKWEMYVANLLYSFVIGYIQVLVIFFIFRYWVGVDFNGRFIETLLVLIPYVFSIVSLSIFITALVKNTQQFNTVLPILAVSMAMIGGAYWPIEIVENEILLFLAKFNPLTFGMEVLNGVAVYDYSFDELLLPISILFFMGVLLMGIGIHLMERRHI
ncbi:ABC transporter permease [Oceanobacillus piezotolerans]|uniref:ABC transporter permease n=1 Tax=Oceanobacillus piezotolerans TaxID=2448030 RepID=A0A498D667_9BACI|nr:ABC transporter permease [Oceanobacillus piezotolerans]RLL44946.1 ABC transporter permease [Oceanobacillus piezotolerans]